MKRFGKLAFMVCLTLIAAAVSHSAIAATLEEQISARLDALEKENAALRARVVRLEASKAAKLDQHAGAGWTGLRGVHALRLDAAAK